ncbi:MAG: putative aldo/keto reductase-like oxidoreductase [Patiriisocius sp.]|jgi:predicted aldo/keto reductase-like oxidoreductase
MTTPIDRRSFLKISALTGLATSGSLSVNALASDDGKTVKAYRRLGRTNLKISDISFGSSRLRPGEEHLVDHALNRGVNYIDTAESYTGGDSERVIGNALKGKRDQVYLATKAHVGAKTSRRQIMNDLEGSLRRLQTDHVEIFFNHAVNDIARLQNDEWFEFSEQAKKQGKISWTGISGHAGNLINCVDYALDNDLVDVLLVAHNFGQDPAFYEQFTRSFDFVANQPDLPRVMDKAKNLDVGVIAMKVLRGAKLNDMRPFEKDGVTYAQAAFKWVHSLPNVDASIISMTSPADIDEYLGASGQRQLTKVDLELLEQYARLTNMSYCRHACNDCSGACPYGVEISDVLRTRMYATDYGDLEFAKREYNMIASNANACLSCDGSPCQDACSHGIDVARLCGPTHVMLG